MTTIFLLLSAGALGIGWFLARKHPPAGRALLALGLLLALGVATHRFRAGPAGLRTQVALATAGHEGAGRALAREAARRQPGGRILILLPPGPLPARESALLAGFQGEADARSLTTESVRLEMPAARQARLAEGVSALPEAARAEATTRETANYEAWLTTGLLAALLREWNGRADFVLYLPRLPADLTGSSGAPFQGGPRLLAAYAEPEQAGPLFARGLAVAAVGPRPDAAPPAPGAAEDGDSVFARHYRLLTPEALPATP